MIVADFRVPNSNAFYVLDGKNVDASAIENLEPGTISTVTVMKNQEAIAQYGAQGKSAVVLITTKK